MQTFSKKKRNGETFFDSKVRSDPRPGEEPTVPCKAALARLVAIEANPTV